LRDRFPSVKVVYEPVSGCIPDVSLAVCGCSVKCAADIECNGRYGKMAAADWRDYETIAGIFKKIIALTEKE
jgi:hypothetical protein